MPDYGHRIEFGVFTTPSAQASAHVVQIATLADREGLDLVTFQDHPYQPRFLDTWTLLSFLAARTSHVHLAANVLNLPLRPPAVLARAMASLDILSGGRAELGIGSGAFWDSIDAMGGTRLTPGQGVDALEEAIDVIRSIWDVEQGGPAFFAGRHYRIGRVARGPAPTHRMAIWVGAYKPRMLSLVGRKADGWLPSMPYLKPGQFAEGNAAIDEAATEAGRKPDAIRRLLNVSGSFAGSDRQVFSGQPATWVAELVRMALEDGVGTFILMSDDATTIQAYASDVAPAVREDVEAQRARLREMGHHFPRVPQVASGPIASSDAAPVGSEYQRLGVTPTHNDGARLSARVPWDESARPHRQPSGPEVTYTERGRLAGKHLIDVHDVLRKELRELRDILVQVRGGAMSAGSARSALNEMALRQNDWALGAFCARYCGVVAQHHGIEDTGIFPFLAASEEGLSPVIKRLTDEHLVIHDAIQAVDAALVKHINDPADFRSIQAALDFLTDSLLSHLSYEEQELVEPLARVGMYDGQV